MGRMIECALFFSNREENKDIRRTFWIKEPEEGQIYVKDRKELEWKQ